MTSELKPCPFGSKGKTEVEGKGQLWRGTAGYSEPQYFHLRHHGRLHDGDTFPTIFVEIRARTEEQAREMWNTRAADPAPAVDPMADPRDFLLKACTRIEQQLDVNEGYFSANDKETLSILQSHIRDDLKAIRAALAALDTP